VIPSEKIALVTGASRGIGKAIALTLGKQGVTVIGTSTRADKAEQISSILQENGIRGMGIVLNITDTQEKLEAALGLISRDFGYPNILINNAGVAADNLFIRMKLNDWENIIETNLTGAYRMIQLCIKSMLKARWGRIVNIGSVVGSTGNPGQANYAAAKAGLIGLTKSLAREIGTRGITVNVVSPGLIETDMTQVLSTDQKEKWMQQIAAGRMGTPEDVASAVAFLASEAAGYITGETLHVNGGMYMA
jgi:3-oxoacyl-[acyl-carrier protein] reductase